MCLNAYQQELYSGLCFKTRNMPTEVVSMLLLSQEGTE